LYFKNLAAFSALVWSMTLPLFIPLLVTVGLQEREREVFHCHHNGECALFH
jgi:hypothetical protein